MGFFGSYGTARDTFDTLGDQAGVRARQELSDREAAAGRLEQMRQNEMLRRFPQVQEVGEFDTPQGSPAAPTAPAQQGHAPRVMQDRLTQLRAQDVEAPNQSAAETARLAGRGTGQMNTSGVGYGTDGDRLAALRQIQLTRVPTAQEQRELAYDPRRVAQSPYTPEKRLEMLRKSNPTAGSASEYMPDQQANEANKLARQGGGQTTQGAAQKFAEAIFAQESTSGQANTTGINSSGVTGPMQMKQATFMGAVKMGLVPGITPQNANWQDPQQNTAVGKAYAAYLFNKYNGDVHKAAAAYFAGEPAVDSGKINLAGTDATGKTIGGYAQDIMRRMGQAATSVLPSANAAETAQAAPQSAMPPANQAQVERETQYRINLARQQMQQLQQLAQVTRDPAKIMQLQQAYVQLNDGIREQQLLQAYTRGQITPEQYRMMSLKEQERSAAYAAEMNKQAAAAQGEIMKAAGTAPYKMQEIEAQGLMQMQKMLAENGIRADEIKGITRAQDGSPALVHTARGVFAVQQTPATKFGPGSMQMTPIQIAPQSSAMGTPGQVQQLQP